MLAGGRQFCSLVPKGSIGLFPLSCLGSARVGRTFPTPLLVAREAPERQERVESREEIMVILEQFDLTGSFQDAGELAVVRIADASPPSREPGHR